MEFTDRLWKKINPIYWGITSHPFNVELSNGTLSQERFNFYLRQDLSYLKDLSLVLADISKKAATPEWRDRLMSFSLDAIALEKDIHSIYLKGETNQELEKTPACKNYISYLTKIAESASLEESLVAILPCFLIYRELFNKMAATAEDCNPYLNWIKTYCNPQYSDATDLVISEINKMACKCSAKVLKLMEDVFEKCALFEWQFWNDAYHMRVT